MSLRKTVDDLVAANVITMSELNDIKKHLLQLECDHKNTTIFHMYRDNFIEKCDNCGKELCWLTEKEAIAADIAIKKKALVAAEGALKAAKERIG